MFVNDQTLCGYVTCSKCKREIAVIPFPITLSELNGVGRAAENIFPGCHFPPSSFVESVGGFENYKNFVKEVNRQSDTSVTLIEFEQPSSQRSHRN